MKNKQNRGLESLRSRYGYSFVAHWIIGLVMFFIIPVITSIIYAFSSIDFQEFGANVKFVGANNFKEILFQNPTFVDDLRDRKSVV